MRPAVEIALVIGVVSGCAAHRTPEQGPGLSEVTVAAASVLSGDSSALHHLDLVSAAALAVAERISSAGPPLEWFQDEIRSSTSCPWAGLSRDSIQNLVVNASHVDRPGVYPRFAQRYGRGEGGAARPGALIAFLSEPLQGMRGINFFLIEQEREDAGGGFRSYGSFNRSVVFLVCGEGADFEILGPKLLSIN